MERIRISDNFFLDEVIDPHTYFKTPEKAMEYGQKVAPMAQMVRWHVGKSVTINNWWAKAVELQAKGKSEDEIIKAIEGDSNLRKWAGSRPKHCPIGAAMSAHKIERMEGAIDCVVSGWSGKALFDMVEAKAKEFYGAGVRRMEDYKDAPNWLHIDRRINTTPRTIRVVGIKSFVKHFCGVVLFNFNQPQSQKPIKAKSPLPSLCRCLNIQADY